MGAADFGARVRQARLELAARRGAVVAQAEIARDLGVTGVTVGRWENGQKVPDLPMIERLAAVLEVEPGWLAFGEAPAADILHRPSVATTDDVTPVAPVTAEERAAARRKTGDGGRAG